MLRIIFIIATLLFGIGTSTAQTSGTVDRAVEYVQKHSYYIPVYTDDSVFMVENYDLYGLFFRFYELNISQYSQLMRLYISKKIPLPNAIAKELPNVGIAVKSVKTETKTPALIAEYTNGCAFNYPLPSNIGDIIYKLFMNDVLVATDCVTGLLCVEPYRDN
ncbi:MAG: hypothetical protein IJS19_01495 [Muribaculaceae bacterium]|nr:hypothetical protein [Muribaculaceae bacterium]